MLENLILLIAETSPVEQVVKELREACQDYEKEPSEFNLQKVHFYSTILLSKSAIKAHGGDLGKTMQAIRELRKCLKIKKTNHE